MGTRCEKQAIDIAWNIVDFTEYENDSENAERQLPRLGSGVRIASPAPFSPDIRDITHARARLMQCYAGGGEPPTLRSRTSIWIRLDVWDDHRGLRWS